MNVTMWTAAGIVSFLGSRRLPLSNEKALQIAIAHELECGGIPAEREVRLNPADVIDFMCCGSVGIEVKIKGSRREIYRQLERYAGGDQVAELILATNVPMGLPKTINGKPVSYLNLSRAWL